MFLPDLSGMDILTPNTVKPEPWSEFEGTETVDEILDHIYQNTQNIPVVRINILEVLAS